MSTITSHASTEQLATSEAETYRGNILLPSECKALFADIRQGRANAMTYLAKKFKLSQLNPPVAKLYRMRADIQMFAFNREWENKAMLDEFLLSVLMDASMLAYEIGLTSVQFSYWITLFKSTFDHVIATSFHEASLWMAHVQAVIETFPRPILIIFGPHHVERMLDFLRTMFDQHLRLIQYAYKHHQEVGTKRHVIQFQFPQILQPLSAGIPSDIWDDWVKSENERLLVEAQAAQEQKQLAQLQKEAELKNQRHAEHCAQLLVKQNEAKMELWKEIPAFNATLVKPSMTHVFHQLDAPQETPAVVTPMPQDKATDAKRKPSLTPANPKLEPNTQQTQPTQKPRPTKLAPPPVYPSKPWTDWKNKTISIVSKERPKTPESPMKEYVPLPPEQPMDRTELVKVVSQTVDEICNEWSNHFSMLIDWNTQHLNDRADAYLKIKLEREAELKKLEDIERERPEPIRSAEKKEGVRSADKRDKKKK